MQTVKKPEWYRAALKRLEDLHASIEDYEDEESITPADNVFTSARTFLKLLEITADTKNIEEPKLLLSPNGHLVLKFGTNSLLMNIRFKPEVSFVLQQQRNELAKGDSAEQAALLVCEKFQVLG